MKIRINDLARELEVKSKAILDVLTEVGVTEKKTHSSSLEDHEAELVRKRLRSHAEAGSASARASRPVVHGEDEIKTKIDLSHISRPGDVLRAITQQKEAAEHPESDLQSSLRPRPWRSHRLPHRRSRRKPRLRLQLRLPRLPLPSRLCQNSLHQLLSPRCGRPQWL